MTNKERARQLQQENTLLSLGFTREQAEQLRRISMTLHRWHELECGDSNNYASWCVVRGKKTGKEFEYDDNGKPFMERHPHTDNKAHYYPIADRETGALKRLASIVATVPGLSYYIQTDPRGAALYIIRPGDVPEGSSVESCYSRGICVY